MTERVDPKRKPFLPEDATRQLYKNWREGFALPLLVASLIFGGIALFPAVSASKSVVIDTIFIGAFLITGLVTVVRFPYIARMSVFLGGVFMLGLAELITHSILGDGLFFFLAFIVFATMMVSPRTGILAIVIDIATLVLFGWLIQGGLFIPLNPDASPAQIADWFSAGIAVVMFGTVIILGFQRLEKEFVEAQRKIDTTLLTLEGEQNKLEQAVQDRTYQLKKINDISHAVTSILDPRQLLPQASRLVEEAFNCYYTAFYIADESGHWAELQHASGEAGKVLKENRHRVDVGGMSTVAKAFQSKTGQIARNIQQIRLDNPLLPYTRSQLVLPLIVGEAVLGVFDMHSSKENAFSQQDVDAYQNMANGFAIVMENTRLFQEVQRNLSEIQSSQRQYLRNAWQSLSAEQDIQYEIGERELNQATAVEIPLSLRNQIIGQIQLANPEEWSAEQKSTVETILAQAALALDNARLVEESQFTAIQERLANEIIAKIWAASNMDNILQVTVRELGRSLEATEVEIEVSMEGNDGAQ